MQIVAILSLISLFSLLLRAACRPGHWSKQPGWPVGLHPGLLPASEPRDWWVSTLTQSINQSVGETTTQRLELYQSWSDAPSPQVAVRLLSHKIQSPQEKEALQALTVCNRLSSPVCLTYAVVYPEQDDCQETLSSCSHQSVQICIVDSFVMSS